LKRGQNKMYSKKN